MDYQTAAAIRTIQNEITRSTSDQDKYPALAPAIEHELAGLRKAMNALRGAFGAVSVDELVGMAYLALNPAIHDAPAGAGDDVEAYRG